MSGYRHIPYGYWMRDGKMEIHPEEAAVVKQIYQSYIDGAGLQEIADELTGRKAEYLPGEFQWNKNRVKRILEDSRYTGEGIYEQIIEPEIQQQANNLKSSRSTTKEALVTAEKKRLTHTVLCGICGNRMHHKTDRRLKHAESWTCSCGLSLKQTIEEIERQIVEQFNAAIAYPALCGTEGGGDCEPSLEVRRLENDIARQIEQPDIDKEAVRELILQCAAMKYEQDHDNRHITQRLKADFGNRSPLSVFSAEFYESVADAALLYPDGTVGVRLRNQTILRKEAELHAGSNDKAEKGCAGNTSRPKESA